MDAHALRAALQRGDDVSNDDLVSGSATLSHDETVGARRAFTTALKRVEETEEQLTQRQEEVARQRARLCNAVLAEVPAPDVA